MIFLKDSSKNRNVPDFLRSIVLLLDPKNTQSPPYLHLFSALKYPLFTLLLPCAYLFIPFVKRKKTLRILTPSFWNFFANSVLDEGEKASFSGLSPINDPSKIASKNLPCH
jgi:hypothetical protein